ncbi:MAG: cellulose biosynthesis protein BcsS [Pseudomonadota bacterium]
MRAEDQRGWQSLGSPESLTILGGDFSVRNRFVSLTEIHAFGSEGFNEPGWRLRIQGGGGEYGGDPLWTPKYAAEAMVGYSWWRGDYGGTVYAGWAANYHDALPSQLQHGFDDGPAVLVEAWWRPAERVTLSAWSGYEEPYEMMQGGVMAERQVTDQWSALATGRAGSDDAGDYWAAEGGIGYSFKAPFMMMGPPQDQALRLFGGVSADGDDSDISFRFELLFWNRH